MGKTLTHDDKFHRKFQIGATGDIVDQGSKLASGIGNLLTVENHLRIVTEDLGAANSIEVRGRMVDESSWNVLGIITGNETKIIDITTYEIVHFFVATYDNAVGSLIATGFVKNAPPGLADAVQICDSSSNCVELIDIGGNYAVPTVLSASVTTPTIYNITIGIGDINVIQSQALINGTTKILIKHRSSASIDFSFTAALTTYIEIPKGASYIDDGLNTSSQTIYFRTDKVGVIEILTWS